jgi:uncharacterized membrane protein
MKMKKIFEVIKKLIEFIGIIASISGFMVMFVTFMEIYFGKYTWPPAINTYGEANVEFCLLLFLLPFVIYSYIKYIKALTKVVAD